jgi:aminomethyltransferase
MSTAPEAAGKRTPLYDIHRQLGARLIHFGGWEMPVSYTGIIEEHQAVRAHAGLFDVSHMGEIVIRPQAEAAASDAQ